MKLSIVIVNYNVRLLLEQCLLSVRKATEGVEVEVYVVDNVSTDGSLEYLIPLFPEVRFIANAENVGFSRANNQAIRQAKGEYVLLLNPDTVVGEETLKNVLRFMDEHADAGAVGVKMIDGSGRFLPESKRSLPTPWNSFSKMFGVASIFPKSPLFGKYRLLYLDKNEVHKVEVLCGAFMMMRSEALAKSGLLDETFFMYGEDIDLSFRILHSGYQVYYLPETIIHYKGESTKKDSLRYVKIFYGAMVIFFWKHYPNYSKLFTVFIKLAIGLHAMLFVLKFPLLKLKKGERKESSMLLPRPGESFAEMIARIEQSAGLRN
jgi:Predicted glycosyltransferases